MFLNFFISSSTNFNVTPTAVEKQQITFLNSFGIASRLAGLFQWSSSDSTDLFSCFACESFISSISYLLLTYLLVFHSSLLYICLHIVFLTHMPIYLYTIELITYYTEVLSSMLTYHTGPYTVVHYN